MKRTNHFYGFFIFMSLLLATASSYAKILVISPHPDDDILIASGIVYRAVERGEPVKIVYMTNGDLNSVATGYIRQGEAVSAQAYLGVLEDQLIFLGYPDYYLNTLYCCYTGESDQFTAPNGQSATYGNRGLGRMDYHSYRFGSPAKYNSYNVLIDLEDLISSFLPDHIFVTSQFDQHPDHATSYALLKTALLSVHTANPAYTPTLHTAIVWTVDSQNWPNPLDPTVYFSEIPNLYAQTGLLWSDRESIDVPLFMQSTNYSINPKYKAISAEESQGGLAEFLNRFIHKDEIFWTENILGSNRPPVPNSGFDQRVSESATVQLDGSGSRDPDGGTLLFQWTQIGGTPVQLSDPLNANPSFTAPAGLTQNETLTFQLVVNDGSLTSVPDSVNVYVLPALFENNIAPLAVVTASSQTPQYGQTALKAVDGVVDGYPGDYTREWATAGEKAGAWINLTWASPYMVDRVVLYDRPNANDQILRATLIFSDGSTIQVGPLDNTGIGWVSTFAPKSTISLKMVVDQVSSTTTNIGLSEIQVFGILDTGSNPVPTTTSISPSSQTAGGSAFTLTVNGTGFVSSSVVRWNGTDRTTTFVSATQLTAAITSADIASAGTAQVTVFSPAPGGGTSNAQTFTVK